MNTGWFTVSYSSFNMHEDISFFLSGAAEKTRLGAGVGNPSRLKTYYSIQYILDLIKIGIFWEINRLMLQLKC